MNVQIADVTLFRINLGINTESHAFSLDNYSLLCVDLSQRKTCTVYKYVSIATHCPAFIAHVREHLKVSWLNISEATALSAVRISVQEHWDKQHGNLLLFCPL